MKFLQGCAYVILVSFVLISIICAIYGIRTLTSPVPTVPTCHNVVMHPEDTCQVDGIGDNNYESQLKLERGIHTVSWVLAGVGALFFGSVGIYGLVKLISDRS